MYSNTGDGQPQTGTTTMLRGQCIYLFLITHNRRCSSVITDINISAIFKLYLSDFVQLFFFCLSLPLFSVLVEVLSKLHAI